MERRGLRVKSWLRAEMRLRERERVSFRTLVPSPRPVAKAAPRKETLWHRFRKVFNRKTCGK